jgi:hypothetical protein
MSECWICPGSRALGSTLVSAAILCNNWYFFKCNMLLILRYTGRRTRITLLTTLLRSTITSKIARSWLHCSSNNFRCSIKAPSTKDPHGTRWMKRVNNIPHVGNGWGGQRGGGGSRATIAVNTSPSVLSGSCCLHCCSVSLVVVVLVIAVVNRLLIDSSWSALSSGMMCGYTQELEEIGGGVLMGLLKTDKNRDLRQFPTRKK